MKQFVLKHLNRLNGILILMLTSIMVAAQEKIEVDKEEIGSWLEQNWIWVAGGVLIVLLTALLARGNKTNRADSATRKTTTVIKDAEGNTRSITTREENI